MGRYRVFRGDCVRLLREADLPLCDLVLTDPPYGISFQSNYRVKSEKFKVIDNDDKPFVEWLSVLARVMKPMSALLCFHRWDVQEEFRQAIEAAGFQIRSQIIWDKQVHGMGDLEGAPSPAHENIWFAVRGNWKFPLAGKDQTSKRPRTVVSFPRIDNDKLTHSNEKPVGLLQTLIVSYSAPGQLVLDPFMGSGSTGEAALTTDRKFLGIELDKDYYGKARMRVKAAATMPSGHAAFKTRWDDRFVKELI